MCHRQPNVARGSAGLRLYARRGGVRETEGGRPERGASASRATRWSASENRFFQRHAVRRWTPRMCATSFGPIPDAIRNSPCPRRTNRFSAFAGPMAASIAARSAAFRANVSARGPGWGRVTHAVGSIIRPRYNMREHLAKFLAGGTDMVGRVKVLPELFFRMAFSFWVVLLQAIKATNDVEGCCDG